MNASANLERPSVLMSHEEHGAITRLTENVAELTAVVREQGKGWTRLEKIVGDLADGTNSRFENLRSKGEFTWEKVGAMVMVAIAIGGPIWALNTLHIQSENAPRDRAAAIQQDRISELYFTQHGHYPPTP